MKDLGLTMAEPRAQPSLRGARLAYEEEFCLARAIRAGQSHGSRREPDRHYYFDSEGQDLTKR